MSERSNRGNHFFNFLRKLFRSMSDIINKRSPLMRAIRNCDESKIEKLLRKRYELLDDVDRKGNTAFMYAVEQYCKYRNESNERILDLLISVGADIDKANNKGETALIKAAQKLDYDMVEYLLEKNANVELEDKYGKKAINYVGRDERLMVLLGDRSKEARNLPKDITENYFANEGTGKIYGLDWGRIGKKLDTTGLEEQINQGWIDEKVKEENKEMGNLGIFAEERKVDATGVEKEINQGWTDEKIEYEGYFSDEKEKFRIEKIDKKGKERDR